MSLLRPNAPRVSIHLALAITLTAPLAACVGEVDSDDLPTTGYEGELPAMGEHADEDNGEGEANGDVILASNRPIHGVNVWYSFDQTYYGATNFLDQKIRVQRDTSGQYYASTFYFMFGGLGYYGLQPDGTLPDGRTNVRQVRFSIWNANGYRAASGTSCGYFSHEGSGVQCGRPYSYSPGAIYTLRTAHAGDDAYGRWWAAWIRHDDSGVWTYIGQIRTRDVSFISQVAQFTESWRQPIPGDCWSIRASEVHMVVPFGNDNNGLPARYVSYNYPEPCSNPSFQLVWQYGTGILRMGR